METKRREEWKKNVQERIEAVTDARTFLDKSATGVEERTKEVSGITDPLTYVQRARTNIFDPYIARVWRDAEEQPSAQKLMGLVASDNANPNIFGKTWGPDQKYKPIDTKLGSLYEKDSEKDGHHKSVFKHICTIGSADIDISDLLQKIVKLQNWNSMPV